MSTDDTTAYLQREIAAFAQREQRALDEYIIAYFGSIEVARQQAQNFVIEEDPTMFEQTESSDGLVVLRATTPYRIRHKTAEELRHI